MEKKTKYLNEEHKKKSEAAMKYIAKGKKLEIDWQKELERMKKNSKDN